MDHRKIKVSDCGYGWMLVALLSGGAACAADLDLSAYRGKVRYVDFWASWCGPCKQSFTWLDRLVREYASQNFVVIGVNVDKDHALAERFVSGTPVDFDIVYDPKRELTTAYKVAGIPAGVLIDRAGHVRFQHAGCQKNRGDFMESRCSRYLRKRSTKLLDTCRRRDAARRLGEIFAGVSLLGSGGCTVLGAKPWEHDLLA
jgi:thiol-disulfide isomerase/thioredoxin